MRDPLLLQNIVEETIITGDEELSQIFSLLLIDIKSMALKSGLEVPKHLIASDNESDLNKMTYRGVPIE